MSQHSALYILLKALNITVVLFSLDIRPMQWIVFFSKVWCDNSSLLILIVIVAS